MNVLIAGATGLIGRALLKELLAQQHQVIVLTRNIQNASRSLNFANGRVIFTDYKTGWRNNAIDIVINLAGSPITRVWTPQQKKKVLNSRLLSTDYIFIRCQQNKIKPRLWLTISSTGYYGHQGSEIIEEGSGSFHKDFLQDVAEQIESNARKIGSLVERHCVLRVGIVLDPDFGFLGRIMPLYRRHLGGVMGSGKQYIPWIHIKDVVKAFFFLINNEHCSGIYNLSAPNPCQQRDFSSCLSEAVGKNNFLHVPSFLVRCILGQRSALVLNSQNVIPRHLLNDGFVFDHPRLEPALQDLLQ